MLSEPQAELDSRFSAPDATPTEWSRVERRLREAEVYQLTTVRRDGRPHVTPLLAIVAESTPYFCTNVDEQKAVNLLAEPRCVLSVGDDRFDAGLDVMVEGVAERVREQDTLRWLSSAYADKYGEDWRFTVGDGCFHNPAGTVTVVYRLRPVKVLAFAKGAFAQTRWRF